MRNGLDISGVSEFVHEIGEQPVEAVIDFHTRAEPGLAGARSTVVTAHHGTQRMARGFHIPYTEHGAHTLGGLTAWESALAALGACVLITHVHGYSARAVTVTSLKVTATAAVDVDEHGLWVGGPKALRDVHYLVEADCEGAVDSVREVTEFVTCFSPNHRAFLDQGTYTLDAAVTGPDGEERVTRIDPAGFDRSAPAAAPAGTVELRAELAWEYGTEAHATTDFAPGGELRRRRPRLVVDQSKQMLGIDAGPNPQELLLSAISADLVHRIGALAAERGITTAGLEVEATGRLDIRGMLNVSPDIPARFHNVGFTVRTESGQGIDTFAELVGAAAAQNVVLAALRDAGTVEVELRSPTESLRTFRSEAAQVEAFVAELRRRQAAAGATNSLTSD